MSTTDPFRTWKGVQREGWATFAPVEVHTTPPAAHLVRFAGVAEGEVVLDVATGTGVVAITAARAGAPVTGLDLTPALLERAEQNARDAGVGEVAWVEGDAELLPFPDASFDVVTSQFGHMFAPRPETAIGEMLRVLRPGGRIVFSTWPPEHMVGRLFAVLASHAPPPPAGAPKPPPPGEWGDPTIVQKRLGDATRAPFFERGVMLFPALSPAHYRATLERTVGPLAKLVEALSSDAARLAALRRELDGLTAEHFVDNVVRQDYLLTRATKRG